MDVIEFEILYKNLISIAEEMGVVLQRSSYSPNIRERLDASCAIYSGGKQLIAQAEHIPVHLGSMHLPLQFINFELAPDDQVILNDPAMGGTHLPDITMYKPVFFNNELVAFVSNRAHHADIGGATPGSMPGRSTEIFQEGMIIPPIKFVAGGKLDRDVLALILANTRTPDERRGDLMAQAGANNYGSKMILEYISRYGLEKLRKVQQEIIAYTKRMVNNRLEVLPKGKFNGSDFLELDSDDLKIEVDVTINDTITVDFAGTSEACQGNINAPLAVTLSAVYFFFRTILGSDIPANSAFYEFINVEAPKRSIVNAPPRAAVVGGNVETSQRIVDTMLNAMADAIDVPAQSHGTMNNISFGNSRFTFYETLGGGAGAGNGVNGGSGVHVYMTNTKNTPVEVIEASYPLLCLGYSLREGTGGSGQWRGGEGIIKHYQALEPCTFSIISDRRRFAPKGVKGGNDGATGKNVVINSGQKRELIGKDTVGLDKDDEVIIMTPGGGGYGRKARAK
ncbi:hydantoinase B/oxoprolinase family protein [[Eubacterium] cellulosolvens]